MFASHEEQAQSPQRSTHSRKNLTSHPGLRVHRSLVFRSYSPIELITHHSHFCSNSPTTFPLGTILETERLQVPTGPEEPEQALNESDKSHVSNVLLMYIANYFKSKHLRVTLVAFEGNYDMLSTSLETHVINDSLVINEDVRRVEFVITVGIHPSFIPWTL